MRITYWLITIFLAALAHAAPLYGATQDYAIVPTPFSHVTVQEGFWLPRLATNRDVTIWYEFHKCEETGRIDNFAKAGGLMKGPFEGIYFNDSDVYKIIEGASYSLATHPDPKLDAYLDALIAKIAAAQEPDGYLYTYRTLMGEKTVPGAGKTRWSHLSGSHELYNVGHLYEAAVAHYQATGKRTLLDVATRNADLICRTFGPDKIHDVPGHEEIEIGLVKLFRLTGKKKYLDLAKFFLDQRGRADGRNLHGQALQDHLPVVQQTEAIGHAVRAGYLYSAMTDIAAITNSPDYVAAVDRLWQNVVEKKLSITGGVGARRHGEAYDAAYKLPNAEAYNETCAAIANALWNHRMFLLHGDGKYVDVLERILYNGFLSGVSLTGDRFFYCNPLAYDGHFQFNQGHAGRSPWFRTSCCPVNVVRFLPSIAGYVYAQKDNAVYVNLFVNSQTKLQLPTGSVALSQRTEYPWKGQIRIHVDPGEGASNKEAEFALHVRIPGWARNQPVPSDLYRYLRPHDAQPTLSVNGKPAKLQLEKGYAVVRRRWAQGDVVELQLPMPVRQVLSHPLVQANVGRVALERGPIVYCVEAVDNQGHALNLSLPDENAFSVEHRPHLLGGVTVIQGRGIAKRRDEQGKVVTAEVQLTAIPYYAWANRQLGEMVVWLPRDPSLAEVPRVPTIASQSVPTASHVYSADTLSALNDEQEPSNSSDQKIPRFTWWDHRGTTEWVQYDFEKPRRVAGVSVYWFDDTGRGGCRVPQSWRVLYKDADQWKPVAGPQEFSTQVDRYNPVAFEPVETTALRLEVRLQPKYSAGILEWKALPANMPHK